MKLLRMEFFKCRRRKIALICLAFVAVQLAWMGRTLTQMEPGELTQGWMSLLYNLAVIDAVMLPLTISALASRNCELEHKGSTWKLWETVTTPQRLFGAKLAWGAILVGGMLLLRTVLLGPGHPGHGVLLGPDPAPGIRPAGSLDDRRAGGGPGPVCSEGGMKGAASCVAQ